jgi:hypothetical protein
MWLLPWTAVTTRAFIPIRRKASFHSARTAPAVLLLLLSSRLPAQSLSLAPAAGAPGGKVAIEISLKSPKGQEPSTLQWQTTVPLAKVGLLEETTPGPAAEKTGKAVNCAVKSKTAETYTTMCLLYGGQTGIQGGVVAVLRLTIASNAEPGSFRIRASEALAVYKDLKRVAMKPVETTVTIRAK